MTQTPIDCNVENCPVRIVLDMIGDKWTSLILSQLAAGSLRHGQLRRLVRGVSQRMLTETLRDLERNGTVRRTVHPTIPPKVEYALTPLGGSLVPLIQAIVRWSKAHGEEVGAAREDYERIARGGPGPDASAQGEPLTIPPQ